MSSPKSIMTPQARARGLGSAGDGVHHWLQERITGAALVPLMLWLVWSVLHMTGWSHTDFVIWLAQPLNAILMLLAVGTAFYHVALGVQVIIEDYVHHEGAKIVSLVLTRLFFTALSVACVFSILKIAL